MIVLAGEAFRLPAQHAWLTNVRLLFCPVRCQLQEFGDLPPLACRGTLASVALKRLNV